MINSLPVTSINCFNISVFTLRRFCILLINLGSIQSGKIERNDHDDMVRACYYVFGIACLYVKWPIYCFISDSY